jgi:hypothetical protein
MVYDQAAFPHLAVNEYSSVDGSLTMLGAVCDPPAGSSCAFTANTSSGMAALATIHATANDAAPSEMTRTLTVP